MSRPHPFLRGIAAGWIAAALGALACTAQAQSAPAVRPPVATQAQAPSGVWYEIFVRSWYATSGDGIGDLNGVTAKLDYLKSLGVSGIWLMPINPSPSYHGYDITDYEAINPQYGTMADFQRLLAEAHKRGIKVIMDLVINHTSDQHPWFKAALDPHSPYHDWYVWAGPHDDLKALSATGGPAWHRAPNGKYYLGVFTGAMPDLNYDNPAVRKEMISVGQFWLAKGVDGFRLDAAQHIYDNFKTDMDSPVALKQNLVWWSEFERGMRAADPQVWNVGEVARQKPADLVPWFGALDSVFNFPLATGLVDAAKSERLPGRDAIQALARTYAAYRAAAGGRFDDAPFLSNHDQERVMSQLDDNPAHMRVAAAMLLTLPGRPFVYYGEELGMRGEKPDEHLREPMRWYRDGKGPGEPSWEGWSSGDGSAVSVQAEQADPGSLLNYYTMLIHWRSQIGALRDGGFKAYPATNVHLAAWERGDAQGTVLVVHNLSGKKQSLSLDVPGEPHFSHVLRQTGTGAELRDGRISLPPYSSVILQ